MLKTLTDLIQWTNSTQVNEWDTWIEWQKNQPISHYEKSEIFQYYLSYHPNFQPPRYSCIAGNNNRLYVYCFGDFATLIVNPQGGGNVVEYFEVLLKIYDNCKGTSRRFTGDPVGISLLRNVVQTRSLFHVQNHDFAQYNYDYGVIHGHTVAQYSLSTLLLRFVSHYMSHVTVKGNYFAISINACQKAYTKCIFGEPRTATHTNSKAMDIPSRSTPITSIQDLRPLSWPRDNVTCIRCKTCTRVTENIWGKFEACLDCHLKRICSECGLPAVIIGVDSFPKCSHHQGKN
jgi:hypothetical protein